MQINVQTQNFTRFEIQGNVIAQDALILKTMLERHLQALEKHEVTPIVVFDMAHVRTIDSAGLGVLITTSTQIRQMGGRIALLNVNRTIRRMLSRANLLSLFDFPKTLGDALTSSL